jgi:predicted Na+-dependent transporter
VLFLLLLNYINAAVAFPSMQSQITFSGLGAILVAALLTCFAGLATARVLGFATRSSPQVVVALDYALMMKNTGLALALANEVLKTQPLVVLPLFAATLVQHLMAGWHHARLQQRTLLEPPAED